MSDPNASSQRVARLTTAYNDGTGVKNSTKSMPSDYTRATMMIKAVLSPKSDLIDIIAQAENVYFKNYSASSLSGIWQAYDNATEILSDSDSDEADYASAMNTLQTALAKTGVGSAVISKDGLYTSALPNAAYPDTYGKKLTDGVKYPAAADSTDWVGYNMDRFCILKTKTA